MGSPMVILAKPSDIQPVFACVAQMVVCLSYWRLAFGTWFSDDAPRGQGSSYGLPCECSLRITLIRTTVLLAMNVWILLFIRNRNTYASFAQQVIGSVGGAAALVIAILAETITSPAMQAERFFGLRFTASRTGVHSSILFGGQA